MRWGGALFVSAIAAAGFVGCSTSGASVSDAGVLPSSSSTLSSWPAAPSLGAEVGASRPGMAFIPSGPLKVGTPAERMPRLADEEMAGTTVEMGGFYIDLLPWPNEPNAIPTTSVTRDEAQELCESKQKRLCTELEWERACKGPDNTTFEYGDSYRKEPCGTGVSLEQAARRPSGEHTQCKSKFGVSELHGGAWEWTSSAWGRGTKDKDASQGVLRGGNSLAGELVGRCANAIARDPSKKSPTMGFRCCSGSRNNAEVHLEQVGVPVLQMVSNEKAGELAKALEGLVGDALEPKVQHTWHWIPIPNEELTIVQGCSAAPVATRKCGFVVGRAGGAIARSETGRDPPEINRAGDFRHLRMRALDPRGIYSRTITYVYGKVELGEPKRP